LFFERLSEVNRASSGDEIQHDTHDSDVFDLLNVAPVAIHFYDKNANLIDCNMKAMKMLEMTDKSDYINNFLMFMPFSQPSGKSSKAVLQELVSNTLTNEHSSSELMYRTADGTPRQVHVTCTKFMYKGNLSVVAFSAEQNLVGVNRDVEADLRATLMLDSTPMACFLADSSGVALDCNAEALQLFGYKSKDETTGHFSDICPETESLSCGELESVYSAISTALTHGRHTLEFTCFDISGSPIPCNITLVRIYYRREHVVAIYIQDLREMKAIIEEMKRIDVAEEENRAKSRFLARVSHEIRTPLNAILGVTETQLLGSDNTEIVENAFMQIYSSSTLLLKIINDLLDLSKVEADRLTILESKYEIYDIIVDTVQLNLSYIADKDVKFELHPTLNVHRNLIGDELRIKQILSNMLSNAFKYTEEGTVELSIGTEQSIDSEILMLVVSITDSGQGMTNEQVTDLFKREFVRYNEALNRGVQGTGLGMSITKQLVDLMNGEIFIKSELGKGTTVTLKIPQKKIDDALLSREDLKNLQHLDFSGHLGSSMQGVIIEPMPYGRVLVVDDVEINIIVAKSMLELYDIQVVAAESGEDALKIIDEGETFDIIFMDHMMPGLDGIETARILFEKGYTNPIVALTANAIVGQKEKFLSEGFSDFISKPIEAHSINNCLIRFIKNKNSQECSP